MSVTRILYKYILAGSSFNFTVHYIVQEHPDDVKYDEKCVHL